MNNRPTHRTVCPPASTCGAEGRHDLSKLGDLGSEFIGTGRGDAHSPLRQKVLGESSMNPRRERRDRREKVRDAIGERLRVAGDRGESLEPHRDHASFGAGERSEYLVRLKLKFVEK
ncbi:MAG: hypothetical protein ACHREM_07005 [Polyangiales bacterium]